MNALVRSAGVRGSRRSSSTASLKSSAPTVAPAFVTITDAHDDHSIRVLPSFGEPVPGIRRPPTLARLMRGLKSLGIKVITDGPSMPRLAGVAILHDHSKHGRMMQIRPDAAPISVRWAIAHILATITASTAAA